VAKHFDTWVICEEHDFRGDIERYLRENGGIDNLHFCFVPRVVTSRRLWRWVYKLRPLYYLAYNRWHRRAYRYAVALHRQIGFDIVHQSTMCGFREPGRMWRVDAPFVWGPVGGTQQYPWRFLALAGVAGALKEGARNVVNTLQLRFSRRVRQAADSAATVITAIPSGKRAFERFYGVKPVCVLDVAVPDVTAVTRRYDRSAGPLRLLWSGTFEHHKALPLLIRALSRMPDDTRYELRILGQGPLEKRWRRLARGAGVCRNCTWMGWLPHKEATGQYDWADVFVFTSLRDTCGSVVLEALSRGLPVICLDHQGAGSVVTGECGIKIPVTTPRRVIAELRDAIVTVGRDRHILEELSRGAVERARQYQWSRHGERIADIYRQVLVKREKAASHKGPMAGKEELIATGRCS